MRLPRFVTPWIVLAAALPAALAAPAARPVVRRADHALEVSTVIYPEQSLPLTFSHAQHLGAAGMKCADCHAAALTSRSSLDQLVPGEDRCRPCHAIDRAQPTKVATPAARCAACHPGDDAAAGRVVARVSIPTPTIKFDHQAHRQRGLDCAGCHGDLLAEGVGLATRAQLPPMSLCVTCHDGRQADGACTVCHLAAGGGRMVSEFAHGDLTPSGAQHGDAHGMSFRTDHAAAAQNNQGYCESCHTKDQCLECHAGVMKPLDFHGNDYITLHSIDARRGSPDCSACHRAQTFCVGCHSRAGVAADGRGSEFVPESQSAVGRRFHPVGWTAPGRPEHALEAQRNIAQCASCHRESDCLTCHSAQPGAPRVNPHPRDWRGSRRCQSLRKRNGRMCLRCHTEDLRVPSCE
ncbi:MAG TPA: cytochrome c3 family protein [Kofleriaceae bacterium]|nr:cytochrome c3 family protein [Kofleriaceae bacterium]